MTKHYIKFWYPGTFVSETSIEEVEKRENRPKLPKMAYAWQYFDREVREVDGETLTGKPKNQSPVCYVGKVLTPEEAIATAPHNEILRSNIENNGYTRLLKTRFGQIMPLNAKDVVVGED